MLLRPPLSLALAGLDRDPGAPWAGGARAAIAWAGQLGLRAIQLDASRPPPHGIRARDLDRSARRDLAALLRRSQLLLSGLDLWIPPEHFVDPNRCDRAIEAALAATELASELAALVQGSPPPVLSVTLPESLPADGRTVFLERAEATGTRIADHTLAAHPRSAGPGETAGPMAVGIDPASLLLGGGDPSLAASRAGPLLASARLSDATTTSRIAPGSAGSRLDQLAYLVALSTAGYIRPLVLDLRGVPGQQSEAMRISSAWEIQAVAPARPQQS